MENLLQIKLMNEDIIIDILFVILTGLCNILKNNYRKNQYRI